MINLLDIVKDAALTGEEQSKSVTRDEARNFIAGVHRLSYRSEQDSQFTCIGLTSFNGIWMTVVVGGEQSTVDAVSVSVLPHESYLKSADAYEMMES